jgi:ABC-2 type transport system ATP-binding protein
MNHKVIEIKNVSKNFTIHSSKSLKERTVDVFTRRKPTQFVALNDISLSISEGETLGLVGHNGSGKSTLLKLIGGIIDPSEGQIFVRGRIAALLELGAGFHPDLTGRENIYLNAAVLGMTKIETDSVIDEIIEFSGLDLQFIDTQVKFYSSGMYVRLAFAVAVHSNPDILLVDEVLAVGDEPFQAKCMAKIHEFQEAGKTIVFVSHGAEQVADVCSRVIVLNHGNVIFNGSVEEGIRRLRDSFENNENEDNSAESNSQLPVQVVDVMVDVDGKGNAELAQIGSTVTITVRVEVHQTSEWITGFTMTNHLGQTVYLLNTKGMKQTMPTSPGRYDVKFILPQTNFGSPRLVVSAGVTNSLGIPFNNLHGHVSFDVQIDPLGSGFVQFNPEFSYKTYSLGT